MKERSTCLLTIGSSLLTISAAWLRVGLGLYLRHPDSQASCFENWWFSSAAL